MVYQHTVEVADKGIYHVITAANGALVSSKSQPGAWYAVRNGRCDCRGFHYRGRCAHRDAVAELEQRQAALRQATTPTAQPFRLIDLYV